MGKNQKFVKGILERSFPVFKDSPLACGKNRENDELYSCLYYDNDDIKSVKGIGEFAFLKKVKSVSHDIQNSRNLFPHFETTVKFEKKVTCGIVPRADGNELVCGSRKDLERSAREARR